ncbi:MAG: hypothetical protein R2853_11895 [Thermomicrobiales bacterium]
MTDLDRRGCYKRYAQMNARWPTGPDDDPLTRLALADQLLATTPNAEMVRAILSHDLLDWLQHDAPANLVV